MKEESVIEKYLMDVKNFQSHYEEVHDEFFPFSVAIIIYNNAKTLLLQKRRSCIHQC